MRNRHRPWFERERKQLLSPELCEALEKAIGRGRVAAIFRTPMQGPTVHEILNEHYRKVYGD